MDELISQIEETVDAIFKYDTKNYAELAQKFVNTMLKMLPAIIDCYNFPCMADVRADATYWPGQMQRIIDVLETGDFFEVSDVLYNETRPNLLELKETLKSKGLQ